MTAAIFKDRCREIKMREDDVIIYATAAKAALDQLGVSMSINAVWSVELSDVEAALARG
jgi:hypothetical protein